MSVSPSGDYGIEWGPADKLGTLAFPMPPFPTRSRIALVHEGWFAVFLLSPMPVCSFKKFDSCCT